MIFCFNLKRFSGIKKMTTIYSSMESKVTTPRIPFRELRFMKHETKESLKKDARINRYILGAEPSLLTTYQKNLAKKIILNGRRFPRTFKVTEDLLNLLIRFANFCANYGVDFRTLDIPEIIRFSPFKHDFVNLEGYLQNYVKLYEKLLYGLAIPIHLFESYQKWSKPHLESLVLFYERGNNRLFRSSIIDAPDVYAVTKFKNVDLNTLVKLIPQNLLALCSNKEVSNVIAISNTPQIQLMLYYRDHLMFQTNQPEIYISRLKGLLKFAEQKQVVDGFINQAKAITTSVIEGVNDLLSYAMTGVKAFSQFFAEKAIKGQVISSFDPIEKQINDMILSAGLGEIDIAVNHANPTFEPNYVERSLKQEKNSMHTKMLDNEFTVIKQAVLLLLKKYGAVKLQSRFEMVTTEDLNKEDLADEKKGIEKVIDAMTRDRKQRRGDMEEHRVFKFPPDHMWECRRPEAIEKMFDGFMIAYERWNEQCHEKSGLSVIGVSHIKLDFMPMISGGCSKGMIAEKLGKGVWVPKNSHKNPVCFWDCLYAGLHPDDKEIRKTSGGTKRSKALTEGSDEERIRHYRSIKEEPKCEMISVNDVPKIAKNREVNITVYTLVNDEGIMIRKKLIEYNAGNPQTVLMHYHKEGETGHYCLINSLVGYGQERKEDALYTCERCGKMYSAKRADRYHKHIKKCEAIAKGEIKRVYPKEKKTGEAKKIRKIKSVAQDKLSYEIYKELAIYFDFESTLEPRETETAESGNEKMKELNKQIPNSYVLKVYDHRNKCDVKEFTRRIINPNSARDIVQFFDENEEKIVQMLTDRWNKNYKRSVLTKIFSDTEEQIDQKESKESKKKKWGIYNKILNEFLIIPVYAYNGGHYDYNFVLRYLRKHHPDRILNRSSDFLSFDYGWYRFMDCRNFAPAGSSLEKFARAFGQTLDLSKDISPYRYFKTFEDLKSREWPAYEWFEKNKVTEEDHKKRKEYFEQKCKQDPEYSLGKYNLEYCEKDVDLLIAGMDGFLELCKEQLKIDAMKFCSISQIAFTVCMCDYSDNFDVRGVPDEESFKMIEGSTYGGNCQVLSYPHMVVKDGEIGFEFDEANLYGKAMRMPIPYKIIKLDEKEKPERITNLQKYLETRDPQYCERLVHTKLTENDLYHAGIARVNLSFTHAQQDKTHMYPALPIKRVVDEKELSAYTINDMGKLLEVDKQVLKCEKIVYDFLPKISYDVYVPALKFMIECNLVTLDKVIDYLHCETGYVMEPFIKAMTERRAEAVRMINAGKKLKKEGLLSASETIKKGETLKDFYKLIMNSAYGKTIQNDEKFHRTVISTRAVDNIKYFDKMIVKDPKIICQPEADRKGRGDEGMCQFSVINPLVKIKAPRHMGAGILWNSKIAVLDFIYNCLLKYCPETEFYYTDTDSVHVKMDFHPAPEEFVKKIKEDFACDDKSAGAIASVYARITDEKDRQRFFLGDKDDITSGKMKVDQILFPGDEGIYLKAKTYWEPHKVRDKGVSLAQNKEQLTKENYERTLYDQKTYKGMNYMIRKVQAPGEQYMASISQPKWILDNVYDKRFKEIRSGSGIIEYYPFGYYKNTEKKCEHLKYNLKQRIQGFMKSHVGLSKFMHKIGEVDQLLGTDSEGLKEHLEKQFTEGMCWGNYGLKGIKNLTKTWNIDHIEPVSELKRSIRQDGSIDSEVLDKIMAEICNYKNLRPMWKKENSAKGGLN